MIPDATRDFAHSREFTETQALKQIMNPSNSDSFRGNLSFDPTWRCFVLSDKATLLKRETFTAHYGAVPVSGPWILQADLGFTAPDPEAAAGIHFQRSHDPESVFVTARFSGEGSASIAFRSEDNGPVQQIHCGGKHFESLQMELKDDRIILQGAHPGEEWQVLGSIRMQIPASGHVGLFVQHPDPANFLCAGFRNVRLTLPAPAGFRPYKDYIGSRLEILHLQGFTRETVFETPDGIEAPNWTPDGRSLIYNSKGLLFRFDLQTRTPSQIDTGFAIANNNDHGISPCGKWLALSHHRADRDPGADSSVYIVPIEGGIPKLVTDLSPSYWHAWSPDGTHLIYTGGRSGQYDIYTIPIEGGPETNLTNHPMLDDGADYSADGKWIYFNSLRTGTMQIWRMRPDGSEPEQITFDSFNDWFPHPSPDGKWIVFLSYSPDIPFGDHPYYRHVMIRIMTASGGAPRVIARLYGGQGTINVPSWAPDSRSLAFVSHTNHL